MDISKTLRLLFRRNRKQSANGNKPVRAIRLRAGDIPGIDSSEAVALAVIVMLTVCAVSPVTCGDDGLKLQVSCDAPEHASEVESLNPVDAFKVAVSVPVPPCAIVRVELLRDPLKLTT